MSVTAAIVHELLRRDSCRDAGDDVDGDDGEGGVDEVIGCFAA